MLAFLLVLLPGFLLQADAQPHRLEVTMTAYSSEVAQTDSTPRITATGQKVRPGIIAVSEDLLTTQLPFGTRVRIVDIRDDPECGGFDSGYVLEVQDVMHERKENQVDVWMPTLAKAEGWGTCVVTLEVVSYD